MAKKLKFNLIVDGVRCKNVEDIQNNFNILDLIEYFKSGKLIKWAKVRDLDDLIQEIENIQSDDNLEIAKSLCRVFDIECDEEELKEELSLQTAEKIANGGEIDKGLLKHLDKLNKIDELELKIKVVELNNIYKEEGVFIDLKNNLMIFDEKIQSIYVQFFSNKELVFGFNNNLQNNLKECSKETNLKDWRTPTKEELKILIEKQNVFKNLKMEFYGYKNIYIIKNNKFVDIKKEDDKIIFDKVVEAYGENCNTILVRTIKNLKEELEILENNYKI